MSTDVDVLIVTALKMEFDAAKVAFSPSGHGAPGVVHWQLIDAESAMPHLQGTYICADQATFKVVLARPARMGANTTSSLAARLVERLRPYCLAMCGVCAGNPAEVALGDVVIAEIAYGYGEGKRTEGGFEGDHRQSPISQAWLRAAQDLTPDGLASFGEAATEDSELWLLERLYGGGDPQKHPARSRYFPRGTWKPKVQELEKRGLIQRHASALELTDLGRDHIQRSILYEVDPPERLPFAIKVGPMASGDVVVKDGLTWDQLKAWGVRTVVGLDMEAAAIGAVAQSSEVPYWIVVKGVMDHADPKKDDRYKNFGAKASAEVLVRFLLDRLTARAAGTPVNALARTNGTVGSEARGQPRLLTGRDGGEVSDAISHNAPLSRSEGLIFGGQDALYTDLNQWIRDNNVKSARVYQYRGNYVLGMVQTLVRTGAEVELYLQDPKVAASLGITHQSDWIREEVDRYEKTFRTLVKQPGRTLGSLKIFYVRPPITIRAIILDERRIAAGWFFYHFVQRDDGSSYLEVRGHDIPGLVIDNGSDGFAEMRSLISCCDEYVIKDSLLVYKFPKDIS